jgi:transposase
MVCLLTTIYPLRKGSCAGRISGKIGLEQLALQH